jgi:hypothetical protein
MTDLYPIDRFHIEQQKEAMGADIRLLEQELRERTRREQVRKAFEGTSLKTRLEQLGRNVKPATYRRAPMFYTEETSRTGQRCSGGQRPAEASGRPPGALR